MGIFASANPEQRQEEDFREMISLLKQILETLQKLVIQ